jgi:hypothetical protein
VALPGCTAPAFHRAVAAHIPEELRPALLPLLRQIEHLTGEIRGADTEIAAICERYLETATLQQIVGVGPITSLTFVLTIEDPARFPKNREIGPYLGLVPRSRDSGDRQPQLRITKEGDVALRRVLNQAAHYILRPFDPDSNLRRWGLRYAEPGAATRRSAPSSRSRGDRAAGGLRRMGEMPTPGRLRHGLVPGRTENRWQRPHPGDRLSIMHRARSGPSTSANGSMANTASRGQDGGTARSRADAYHGPADRRRYR